MRSVRSGERISALTRTPFGLNLLVFAAPDSHIDAVLACVRVSSSPPVPLVERLAADAESVLRTRSRELIG